MEHAPVKKLPADLWGPLKQTEAVRVDQLQRQDLGQLCSTACILAVDTDLELTLAIPRDTQRTMPAFSQFDLTKNCTALLLVLDDGVESHTAKRTRQPQQVDSFQHAGFSAAAGPSVAAARST